MTRWIFITMVCTLAASVSCTGEKKSNENSGDSEYMHHERTLRRDESFLGVHFDFHAGYDCTEIGKTVTPEMIERVIEQVHPDYLQCDCKGHPGISSYPTKVGNPAPGFVRDQLRIWRDVTHRTMSRCICITLACGIMKR